MVLLPRDTEGKSADVEVFTLLTVVKASGTLSTHFFLFYPHQTQARGQYLASTKMVAISWFSCGVASAVATKLLLQSYQDVRIIYIHLSGESADNMRFLKDCERWYNHPIEIVIPKYAKSHWEVIEKQRGINTPYGAPCTMYLKKKTRWQIEDEIGEWDIQALGYDITEKHRAERFHEQYPKTKAKFPLIEANLTKQDAQAIVIKAGIKVPLLYRQGFRNNNCIGCVKGGKSYWSRIRKFYPEAFERMAKLEIELKRTCINGLYLEDLPKDYPMNNPIVPSCSLFCDPDFMMI